jgi:hypothetical protein
MRGKDTDVSSKLYLLSRLINFQGKIIDVYVKKKMTQHPALRNPMFKNLPTRTKIPYFEDLSSTLCFLLYKYDLNQSETSPFIP